MLLGKANLFFLGAEQIDPQRNADVRQDLGNQVRPVQIFRKRLFPEQLAGKAHTDAVVQKRHFLERCSVAGIIHR